MIQAYICINNYQNYTLVILKRIDNIDPTIFVCNTDQPQRPQMHTGSPPYGTDRLQAISDHIIHFIWCLPIGFARVDKAIRTIDLIRSDGKASEG